MDIGFLFGWAKEQGVKVPQKSDGSANINELFALYNEWKKKQTAARRATLRDKGVDTDGMDDAAVEQKYEEYTGKASGVVELDENSELMKRVEGLSRKERVKAVENYLREVLGGREIEFHDGIKATVTGRDANKLARDTYHAEKGERRTAELAEVEKLIGNARYQENGKVIGHNEEKFTMFRYYAVTTRYKGEEETLRFNVGKDKYTGKYRLYAITVIK